MNTLRKVLMLVLAMVLVLGLVACGPKKNEDANPAPAPQSSPSGEEAQQIVTAAPGKITILTEMELTLGFDNNGNALALTGNSDVASRLAAQCNIAGKSCADAMAIILPLLTEHAQIRGFITIRQEPGSVNPGEHFMSNIAAAAEKADAAPVVVIAAADMDSTGYFNQSVAEKVVRAAFGDQVEVRHITAMYEGRYVVTIAEGSSTADYAISALTGTVSPYTQETDEAYDETMDGSLDDPNDNPNEELEEETSTEEETEVQTPAA